MTKLMRRRGKKRGRECLKEMETTKYYTAVKIGGVSKYQIMFKGIMLVITLSLSKHIIN